MPSPAITAPPHERPLLLLLPGGQATLNREASRVLPAAIAQVRLAQPTTVGSRWRLLPDIPGGHAVRRRADRLGCLRFTAPWWAAQCFAALPPDTPRLYFELVPWAAGETYFTLEPMLINVEILAVPDHYPTEPDNPTRGRPPAETP